MSVFKKLRGTFQTAQQDFVDSLRNLTSFDGYSKTEQIQHIKSKDISLDVGADLLHEYQEMWSHIQHETKLCSNKAEEVDGILTPMFTIWDKRTEEVTAMEEEVKAIPAILSTLKDLHILLETVRQDFSVTESALSLLENVCEDTDLKRAIEDETKKLNMYRLVKEKELERVKVNLARTHAKRMQDIESSKTLKMKERAEAFTSAFEEDVDYYKTHGRPDSKLVTEFPKVTSLSEIEIVDDGKDLATFLGPQTEEEQDGGEEEQYFEDDYTTDFSVKEDLDDPEEGGEVVINDAPLFSPLGEDVDLEHGNANLEGHNNTGCDSNDNCENCDSPEVEGLHSSNSSSNGDDDTQTLHDQEQNVSGSDGIQTDDGVDNDTQKQEKTDTTVTSENGLEKEI